MGLNQRNTIPVGMKPTEKINKMEKEKFDEFVTRLKEGEYCKCEILGDKGHKIKCGFCRFVEKIAKELSK